MRFDYRIVNVFAQSGDRLTGNPLCVFEDARGLDDARMQALALQFNLSETTFVLPSDKADARVRIFTPDYEMPFAGHPTLGTAFVLADLAGLGECVRLELQAGVIPVRAGAGLWELTAPAAATRPEPATADVIATCLGLEEGDIGSPALWVNAGSEQLVVPVATPSAVARARVSFEGLSRLTAGGALAQVYLFAPGGAPDTLVSRFFFSKGASVLEDPATGSATANLGGWYLAQQASLPLRRSISQGEQAGRPSILRLRIDGNGQVFVAGEVVELGRGYIEL